MQYLLKSMQNLVQISQELYKLNFWYTTYCTLCEALEKRKNAISKNNNNKTLYVI
jgi:hypothetical protein